ncbi:MAG: glutathione S-transferase family protein [Geminicoccaceae bacterium]
MQLHSNPASPFGRKVKIVAHETGQFESLVIHNLQTSAVAPDLRLAADNPLGKIPCLVLTDGTALYDSRVICEYLDTLHAGPPLFPPAGAERWNALRLQALCDGIMDAALLARYETFLRPEENRWPAWIDGQLDKVHRALDRLEAVEAGILGRRPDIGTISTACALGYLDFRFAGLDWRARRPVLAAWFAEFAARPSMVSTAPPA